MKIHKIITCKVIPPWFIWHIHYKQVMDIHTYKDNTIRVILLWWSNSCKFIPLITSEHFSICCASTLTSHIKMGGNPKWKGDHFVFIFQIWLINNPEVPASLMTTWGTNASGTFTDSNWSIRDVSSYANSHLFPTAWKPFCGCTREIHTASRRYLAISSNSWHIKTGLKWIR